jgi:antitoxin component of MazEF toxin-antitoxin module
LRNPLPLIAYMENVSFQLRKIGGSLFLRIPANFVRANDLKTGDYLVLDLAKVGIVKQTDFAEVMKPPALEPAE